VPRAPFPPVKEINSKKKFSTTKLLEAKFFIVSAFPSFTLLTMIGLKFPSWNVSAIDFSMYTTSLHVKKKLSSSEINLFYFASFLPRPFPNGTFETLHQFSPSHSPTTPFWTCATPPISGHNLKI
jgi:hypothetical protein